MYDHFQNKIISSESQLHQKIETLNKMKYSPIPKTKYLGFLQSHSRTMYQKWKENITKTLSTNIALDLLGSQTSALSISLLGIGTLQAWLTGETLQEQDKRKLAMSSLGVCKVNENPSLYNLNPTSISYSHRWCNFVDQVNVDATDFRRSTQVCTIARTTHEQSELC